MMKHNKPKKISAYEVNLELLKIGHSYLKKIKVPHWIDFGTLLGAFREGKIMAHDLDVDFGFPVEYGDVIKNNIHLLPSNVEFYDTTLKHPGSKFGLTHKESNSNCDFYSYTKLSNGYLRYNLDDEYKGTMDGRDIPYDFIFPLQKCKINGFYVYCPNKTKEYLKNRYGYLGRDAVKDKVTGWYRPRIIHDDENT